MEHVTYLCIWETSVDILILFVQRMFCNGEGAKRFMATHSKIGESQYFFFVWFLFSVLIVIVHACLFREEDTLVFLFEM